MASEQTIANDVIAKAVAEATRATIQAMAAATAEMPQNMAGSITCRPAMKQPTFNWEVDDKHSELISFRLEVNNILTTYNTPQTEQLAMVKKLARQKSSAIHRVINKHRKRYMQHIRRLIQNIDQKV